MDAVDSSKQGDAPCKLPVFFPVSVTKLLVLSVCTLGFYELYWFYRNWEFVREREQIEIMPGWRAIFNLFFCYALFNRVCEKADEVGVEHLGAGQLAAGWVVLSLFHALPDSAWWMLSIFAMVILVVVQGIVNRINAVVAPGHDPNVEFSQWNKIAVLIGGTIFLLVIVQGLTPSL